MLSIDRSIKETSFGVGSKKTGFVKNETKKLALINLYIIWSTQYKVTCLYKQQRLKSQLDHGIRKKR